MTKTEFTAKCYELLDEGKIEVDGEIYYSEESVMKCLEWVNANLTKIIEIDAEKLLENVFKKFT